MSAPAHEGWLAELREELPLDSAERGQAYLVVSPHGAHIKLSAGAYALLRQVREGASFEELAQRLGRRRGVATSAAEVERAYEALTRRIAAIDARPLRLPGGFWLRVRCLPEPLVVGLARRLSWLLHPLALGLLGAAALLLAYLGLRAGLGVELGGADFWGGYGLFILSLLAHELGHAAACARYGARPSEIGFAIYLIYPVFYSNVTSAWRLRRRERLVVDLGGIIFQLLFAALLVAGYLWSGSQALRYAFLMIVMSCLFSLNPILKFDGYWVVADLLGVVNLDRQPLRITKYYANKLAGRRAEELPWGRGTVLCLLLYTLLSVGFWSYFLLAVMPMLWGQLRGYPRLLWLLAQRIAGQGGPLPVGYHQELLGSTFVAVIAGLLAYRALVGLGGLRRRRAHS